MEGLAVAGRWALKMGKYRDAERLDFAKKWIAETRTPRLENAGLDVIFIPATVSCR